MPTYPRPRFQVWLLDPSGRPVALIPQAAIGSLVYSRNTASGQLGNFAMSIAPRFDVKAGIGWLVSIWMSPLPELALRHEGVYLIEERTTYGWAAYSQWSGDHINKLLAFRIVAFDRGESGADKTGPADNVMKAYVRENAGDVATAGGGLSIAKARDFNTYFPFVVEGDYGLGPTVTKEAGRASLLDTVQQIQKAAAESEPSPTWMMWQIEPTGWGDSFGVEFRTWVGQRVHRGLNSAAPLVLSQDNCLTRLTRQVNHSRALTHALVGGQGTGSARTDTEVENTRLAVHAPWWRREGYVDAGQTTDSPTMQEKGYRLLRERRPGDSFTATLRPHPTMAYGLNLDIGVRVVADARPLQDVIIEGATIKSDGRGVSVDMKMETTLDE